MFRGRVAGASVDQVTTIGALPDGADRRSGADAAHASQAGWTTNPRGTAGGATPGGRANTAHL